MISFNDYDWAFGDNKIRKVSEGVQGVAIAFVIETEVAETIAVDKYLADLLFSASSFSESEGFSVNIIKDGAVVETLLCDERLNAVLLSEPSLYDISMGSVHRNAEMVSPGWSFVDGSFIIPGEYE